ncbi:MAG: hypothetical protein JSR82_02250 [Verrucomicrobia bacterium]|nr:hypothetical protein [Verrucomicrobiota bacterium]
MNDSPPLPELRQATLDATGLATLLSDLALCTEVLAVLPKSAARELSSERPLALAEASEALQAGRLRGVQVRYRFDGAEWWDTLITAGPSAWRLVRIRHDQALAAS